MPFKPRLTPFLKKLKRGPAVILPKDIGIIVAYAEINRDSVIVDIGGGSGFLALSLARIAKKVITYEREKRFAKIIKENIRLAGVDNVVVKEKDAKDGIDEEADVITMDTPDAPYLVEKVYERLKPKGYVVAYLPNIEQAKEFYMKAQPLFSEVFMVDCMLREYEVREKGTRPKHIGLMHTAYLVFCRK